MTVVALLLVLVLIGLAVTMASTTALSLAQSDNLQKVTHARLAAESGLAFCLYHLRHQSIPAGSAGQSLLDYLAASLAAQFDGSSLLQGLSVGYDGTTIALPPIRLDAANGQTFSTEFVLVDGGKIRLYVTGRDGPVRRRISIDTIAAQGSSPIFDFGIASRSPVELTGNASVGGLNNADEAKILSATDEVQAFNLTGNVDLEGDIYTTNPSAAVSMTGNVSIGGVPASDPDIHDHIHLGQGASEFPEVDPAVFEPFATTIVTASTPTSGNRTFQNIRIEAGANPTFSGNITIRGVVFIEMPNRVHFSGNTTLTGVIVTEDAGDDAYDENTIRFTGNMSVRGVEELPDTGEFQLLKTMPGAFILAPGFGVTFTGNFGTVSGCMAADSFAFTGNAGGIVRGGIINYSDSTFRLTGNSRVIIDREHNPHTPPGFALTISFTVRPDTYTEYPTADP